jgi:hypothetical protein
MITPLTTEYIARTNQSIAETHRLLSKELSYSKDLQHKDVITRYKAHLVKLNDMLKNGWNAPSFS